MGSRSGRQRIPASTDHQRGTPELILVGADVADLAADARCAGEIRVARTPGGRVALVERRAWLPAIRQSATVPPSCWTPAVLELLLFVVFFTMRQWRTVPPVISSPAMPLL